jgi:hypothetical protein
MTRDQALIIAKRIMRRIEDDQAIHMDSLADELVMAMAVQKPAIVQSFVGANKVPLPTMAWGTMTDEPAESKDLLRAKQEKFDQWAAAVQAARQRGYLMGV